MASRAAGILLHLSSLPGPYGAGNLGPEAERFAGFLNAAGQTFWQTLPVGPPGAGDSPYQALSSFAGNPLFIGLEPLAGRGLLRPADLAPDRDLARSGPADYAGAWRFKEPRLREAFRKFRGGPAFDAFRRRSAYWLEDYALYAAVKRARGHASWVEWESALRRREASALARERKGLAEELRFERFLQFEFDRQWRGLRRACAGSGVRLIGDIPIFAAGDSADVWANQELFHLDKATGLPALQAGVPPDYFSKTGQLWGNPLYRWDRMRLDGYAWWAARLQRTMELFDLVRIDHFIGFHRCWAVPAGEIDARRGSFRPGPGAHFFETVRAALGRLPFIAEDLGVVTPEVRALRERFGLPGMRVLQFAFGDDPEASNYQPHNYPPDCVVYTGTHDNDTTAGWFRDRGGPASTRSAAQIRDEKAFALRYLGTDGREIHWDMIRLAWMSVARLAVVPAQDLLGLGSEARMNRPGLAHGQWRWRLRPKDLSQDLAARLRAMTRTYGR